MANVTSNIFAKCLQVADFPTLISHYREPCLHNQREAPTDAKLIKVRCGCLLADSEPKLLSDFERPPDRIGAQKQSLKL